MYHESSRQLHSRRGPVFAPKPHHPAINNPLCQLTNTFTHDFSCATVVVHRGWLDLQGTFAILRRTACCYI